MFLKKISLFFLACCLASTFAVQQATPNTQRLDMGFIAASIGTLSVATAAGFLKTINDPIKLIKHTDNYAFGGILGACGLLYASRLLLFGYWNAKDYRETGKKKALNASLLLTPTSLALVGLSGYGIGRAVGGIGKYFLCSLKH